MAGSEEVAGGANLFEHPSARIRSQIRARVASGLHPINSHDRKFKNIPAYSRWRLEIVAKIVSGRLIQIAAVANDQAHALRALRAGLTRKAR